MNARLVATLLAFVGSTSYAQTADEIVARYVAARGGLERIRSVASMRMTGTISSGPGEKGPLRLEVKRPGRMRVEMVVQGATLIQATDGTTAWVISPMLDPGSAFILPPEEARGLKEQADIEGPLVDWKAKGNQVELLAREKRPGGEAFRLKVRLKSGEVRYVAIDAATYRQVAEEGERPSPRGPVTIETRLSDHRVVDGLLIPFVLDIGMKGGEEDEQQKVVFSKVEVNVAIDDARFATPAGARRAPRPPDRP
jgi:outer membrane lipoprotein-sorting protein